MLYVNKSWTDALRNPYRPFVISLFRQCELYLLQGLRATGDSKLLTALERQLRVFMDPPPLKPLAAPLEKLPISLDLTVSILQTHVLTQYVYLSARAHAGKFPDISGLLTRTAVRCTTQRLEGMLNVRDISTNEAPKLPEWQAMHEAFKNLQHLKHSIRITFRSIRALFALWKQIGFVWNYIFEKVFHILSFIFPLLGPVYYSPIHADAFASPISSNRMCSVGAGDCPPNLPIRIYQFLVAFSLEKVQQLPHFLITPNKIVFL